MHAEFSAQKCNEQVLFDNSKSKKAGVHCRRSGGHRFKDNNIKSL